MSSIYIKITLFLYAACYACSMHVIYYADNIMSFDVFLPFHFKLFYIMEVIFIYLLSFLHNCLILIVDFINLSNSMIIKIEERVRNKKKKCKNHFPFYNDIVVHLSLTLNNALILGFDKLLSLPLQLHNTKFMR